MNNIDLENEIIVLSLETITKLFKYENGADLVSLYLFYHKQCKLQKTNQSFTVGDFAKKGLKWGDSRFKKAKKILKELELIEDICDRGENGKIKGWFIKLKFIKTIKTTGAEMPLVVKNHPLDETTDGFQETNALSSLTINALSSLTENSSKEEEQSSEVTKIDKRILEIDIIIETIKAKHGTIDGTIKEQRQYGKLLKDKLDKIKGFNGDYSGFISYLIQNTDQYSIGLTTSPKSIYYNLGKLIAKIKTKNNEDLEKKQKQSSSYIITNEF